MTELLEHAFAEVQKFPAEVQDAIAARILDDLEDERQWEALFAATTDEQWHRMAEMVRRDIRAGNVAPLDDVIPPDATEQ
jgi:hypothetical protein